jgi:ectoine hydroxylase
MSSASAPGVHMSRPTGLSSRRSPAPVITPRVDPVSYGTWNSQAPLSRSQTKFYDEMGYLHLQNVFSPAEVAELQGALGALRADTAQLDPEEVIAERGSQELRSVFRIHATHQLFARLAADERLVRIARFLLDDDVYIHQSRVNFKPGFAGREFYWHSDFETWHVEDGMPRMRALSMSISLSKVTDFNGPLLLIPRSQSEFIGCVGATPENHYRQSLKKQEYGVPDADSLTRLVAKGGIVSATGPAGSVTIFDCNTMHGSNSNITPHARSNIFLVYNACVNKLTAPFGGSAPRPEFLAARRDTAALSPESGLFC